MGDVILSNIGYGICYMIAAFVALWCIGMLANWVVKGRPNRFNPPEE